jgi:hypothetical protein
MRPNWSWSALKSGLPGMQTMKCTSQGRGEDDQLAKPKRVRAVEFHYMKVLNLGGHHLINYLTYNHYRKLLNLRGLKPS